MVLGCLVTTTAYAATIRARLGLGPLFAVQEGIANHTGMSIGTTVMIVGVALMLLAALVRHQPGPGTVVLPFLIGAMVDRILPHIGEINGLAIRFAVVLVGTFFMCCGGALVIRAALGAPAIDGVMLGLTKMTGWPVRRVRLAMEAVMLALGWILGGSIGVGTVITGALVGPSLHFWLNLLDKQDADQPHVVV